MRETADRVIVVRESTLSKHLNNVFGVVVAVSIPLRKSEHIAAVCLDKIYLSGIVVVVLHV